MMMMWKLIELGELIARVASFVINRKVEAASSSEVFLPIYQTTWCHIPKY
jgi:hypothetical protein